MKKINTSDVIEKYIKSKLEIENEIELKRNDLAIEFNCVPSQINYVLTTRFKPESGYYVESKRGEGGYIKIRKISFDKNNYIMNVIEQVGDYMSSQEVDMYIGNFLSYDLITIKEAKLLKVATNDKILIVENEKRDLIRSNIFKNMLLNILDEDI